MRSAPWGGREKLCRAGDAFRSTRTLENIQRFHLSAFYSPLRLYKPRRKRRGGINPYSRGFETSLRLIASFPVGSGVLLPRADVQQPVSCGDSLVRGGVGELLFFPRCLEGPVNATRYQADEPLLVLLVRAAAEWWRSAPELMGRFISSEPSGCRDDHGRQEGGLQTQPAGHRRAAFQGLRVVSHSLLPATLSPLCQH